MLILWCYIVIKKSSFFSEKQLTDYVILPYIEYILNEEVLNIEPKRTERKKAGGNSGCRIGIIYQKRLCRNQDI